MARATPVLISDKIQHIINNSYNEKGFDGINAGELILAVLCSVKNQNIRMETAQYAEGTWYSFEPNATGGGEDLTAWATTWPQADLNPADYQHVAWKIADGTETSLVDLWGKYGYTSYGEDPNWLYTSLWSGVDPDTPVRAVSADVSTTATTFASAAADELRENCAELLTGTRSTGQSLLSFDREDTVLQSATSSADGDGSMRIVQNTGNSDGSLDAFTSSGSGTVRARRITVHGAVPSLPQFGFATLDASATLTARGSNVSQERRNAAQAQDRREHIWVSDINGVRKVVMR